MKYTKFLSAGLTALGLMFAVYYLGPWHARSTLQEMQIIPEGKSLFRAARLGRADETRLLLKAGVDVDFHETDGITSLIKSAQLNHFENVKVLLEAGANPNAQDDRGWTALMFAAKNGNQEAINLLLKKGADISLKNSEGEDAPFVAKDNGHNVSF